MLNVGAILVTSLNVLVIAAVFAGVILLEVWLSRRKSRWPGLILPILTLALSLAMLLGFAAYSGGGTVTSAVTDPETGEVLQQSVQHLAAPPWTLARTAQVGVLLLVGNIPTFVLLGAYFAGREKLRREELLEKMNIQDL
ncbi:MAG: hypothetical protein Q4C72_07805 [Eubacteriales bacterium]|nr:hypothetical protein [Eubacteriales bacterium]